jgi:hypothetical protein
VHDADHRNTVFFEDEIFAIDMGAPDDLPKVDAGFGEGNAMDYAFHDIQAPLSPIKSLINVNQR